jgi:hypothetical protein
MLNSSQECLLARLNMREAAHMRLVFECGNAEDDSTGEYILRRAHLEGFREGVFACCKVSVKRQAVEASLLIAQNAG